MIPPFMLPLPGGSTERERQQLLHDWLAAEVQVRQYSQTVGGLIEDGDSDLAARKRRANSLLVDASIRLRDCRDIIDRRIAELKSKGEWRDGWPDSAEAIVRFTIDLLSSRGGLGLWPMVIAAVLVLLAAGASIALLAIPLEDIHRIIEQLPDFDDVIAATGKATGFLLAITAALGGAYLLWKANK